MISSTRTAGHEVIGLAPPPTVTVTTRAAPESPRLGWAVCPRCSEKVTYRSYSGVVTKWCRIEGWGTIKPDDGSEDLYFDRRACNGSECNIPEGDRVTYTEQWEQSPRSSSAAGMWLITSVNGLWQVVRSQNDLASSSRTRSRSRSRRRGLSSLLGGSRSRSLPATAADRGD